MKESTLHVGRPMLLHPGYLAYASHKAYYGGSLCRKNDRPASQRHLEQKVRLNKEPDAPELISLLWLINPLTGFIRSFLPLGGILGYQNHR